MLSGDFENCYGLKKFVLKGIKFSNSNKAVLYAPNGAMKTSFTKTFEILKSGRLPEDRIFKRETAFKINYREKSVTHKNVGNDLKQLPIYVIHSFNENFQSENISTLLVDRKLKEEYDKIFDNLEKSIGEFEKRLNVKSKIPKKYIKEALIKDLSLAPASEWGDVLEVIKKELSVYEYKSKFEKIIYSEVVNVKTEALFKDIKFKANVERYIEVLDDLVGQSNILAKGFDDHNVSELSRSFKKNDLFKAEHLIQLKDGTAVKTVKEWEEKFNAELKKLEASPELNAVFNQIGKQLNANIEVQTFKNLLKENQFIIKYLNDLSKLKKLLWLNYVADTRDEFEGLYDKFSECQSRIREIYFEAGKERESWEKVVSEFNERFSVPYKIKIKNQANILLKDEAPNIVFLYSQGGEEVEKKQTDLMQVLSMGEKRALYLLHILFDLEAVKKMAASSGISHLVIADDIADSFDYKNKYAIVEYLKDISDVEEIDLLILTHNFDFYRTVATRMDIQRENCFIVQRDVDDNLIMSALRYRSDVFKHEVVDGIANGNINNVSKKKWLVACVPFCRNLADYQGNDAVYSTLTSLLHLKNDSESITIKLLWNEIGKIIETKPLFVDDDSKSVLGLTFELADAICNNLTEEVYLENKIILSIAIRLKAELFMRNKFQSIGKDLPASTKNQTTDWFKTIKSDLTATERQTLQQVNMMTPENIHINAFMYEPIIDLSDWHLKRLYEEVKSLV